MNRRFLSLLLGALVLLLVVQPTLFAQGTQEAQAAKPVVLRLAHISNEEHPSHIASLKFKEIVEKETNGNVVVEVYSNSSLGSAPEYTEQLKLGTVELGLVTSGQLQVWAPENGAVMIPFLFESYDHAHRALDGEAGKLLAEYARKQGFVVVSNWEWGFRQLSNNKLAVTKPEDLAKLKMRVPNEIQLMEMYKALGSTTAIIAFPELYMALAQGVVDGQCNPLSTIYYQKLYEVQPYVTILNHVYNTQMLVASEKAWNSLSPAYQQIVQKASDEAGKLCRELTVSSEEKIIEMLKSAGVKVNYPDLAPFRAKMAPAIKAIAAYAGNEFTDKFVKLVEAAR
jgi:tripartite ATP-independent transporter DctP family solute receptor